jgi:hypothetical protein
MPPYNGLPSPLKMNFHARTGYKPVLRHSAEVLPNKNFLGSWVPGFLIFKIDESRSQEARKK